MPPRTKKDVINLHDNGDVVTLIIGKSKLSVTTSKTVLTILSPVFKAMLAGGFREAGATISKIPLPDDDPNALLLLLRIAHLKFKDLPNKLSFRELYRLAVVCDKYDAIGTVRPFWDKYGAPFLTHMQEQGYEEWLYIAWAFGIEDVCIRVMKRLALETIIIKGELSRANRKLKPILPPYACGECTSLIQFIYTRSHLNPLLEHMKYSPIVSTIMVSRIYGCQPLSYSYFWKRYSLLTDGVKSTSLKLARK